MAKKGTHHDHEPQQAPVEHDDTPAHDDKKPERDTTTPGWSNSPPTKPDDEGGDADDR